MYFNELYILSLITTTILGVLFILLVYLMVQKSIEIKKRQAIETYKEKFNPMIFRFLTEGCYPRELIPETALQQKAMEELLDRYVSILEGVEEENRLSELAKSFLTAYYQKRLKSKRWSHRMNVLYHIEDFKMSNFQEEVLLLMRKKGLTNQETVLILRILASIQYPQISSLLAERFFALSEYDYRTILIRLENHLFNQFILSFHTERVNLKKAILDVISLKRDFSYLTFTENIFSSYSGEIKLRALKALADMGFVKNTNQYIELLYSSKWQERMFAAKLIGAIKEEAAISRLIELLHDQSWWVRSQAGQAINQFPDGKKVLRDVLATSNDEFAKDMAWEWLHKGV